MSEDHSEMLNARRGGYNRLIGLEFVSATKEEVVARLTITDAHRQPYGVVHGGVYASMAETVASVGAALHAMADGRSTVGLENTTSFLRATREGALTATATPLATGRRTHVWEVAIRSDDGRLAAKGRVRLLCLEGGAELAGQVAAITERE